MLLQPTISLSETSATLWDVVIAGAGPAGASAAIHLAKRGLSVLLVDRATFPRWKICGCCLNKAAVDALVQLGMAEPANQLGAAPLHQMDIAFGHAKAALPLPGGVSLSRTKLDAELVRLAVAAGASFLPATEATLDERTSPLRTCWLRAIQQLDSSTRSNNDPSLVGVTSQFVIAADGLTGKFLSQERNLISATRADSRIGAGVILEQAGSSYRPGIIYMACHRNGYLGLVRLEDGRLNLAAAMDSAFVKTQGVGAAAQSILQEVGWPVVDGIVDGAWRGTPRLTRRPGNVAAERVFLIGDAGGYVEPFTGEGIAWALHSAAAAAPIVEEAVRSWRPHLVRQWQTTHAQLLAQRQWACRWITRALRRPALVQMTLAVLARLPGLAQPVMHYLNKPPSLPAPG